MEKEYIYEVWALGYDKDDRCTDTEILMAIFQKPEQAIKYAECFETLQDVTDNFSTNLEVGEYFNLRVEKVGNTDPHYAKCVDILYEAELK